MGALRELQESDSSQNREIASWKMIIMGTKGGFSRIDNTGVKTWIYTCDKAVRKKTTKADPVQVCLREHLCPHAKNFLILSTY